MAQEENQGIPTETASSGATSKKSKSRQRSDVWDDFVVKEGADRCECKHCGQTYKYNKSSLGTSTLRSHLKRCLKNPNNSAKKQKTLVFEKGDGVDDAKLYTASFDQNVCKKSCAEYIICGELPFRHVESQAFKTFCLKLQPKFKPQSRTTVSRDCYKMYLGMKEKLVKSMKKHRVSLTTDTWRSIQNINYMCVTSHFIDKNWVLHKKIVNFFQVPNHKGETISRELEACMQEWSIKKLCSITVDNASSNDAALVNLRRKLDSIVLDSTFLHLRCGAHIINLIVNDGLKEIESSVVRIRLACKYVRSSTTREQTFKECCEREKIPTKALLCLDVATRWNSTYLMLDTAIRFQKAFDAMVGDGNYDNYFKDDNEESPSFEDWEKVREYSEFLKSFYTATKKFSGSSFTTTNLFLPEIFEISQKLDDMMNRANNSSSQFRMAQKMKTKFDKYWGEPEIINPVLFVAAALDPRFKLKLLRHFYGKRLLPRTYIDDLCWRIEQILKQLYNLYDKENPQPSATTQTTQDVPVESENLDSSFFSDYADPDEISTSSAHEVDKYLNARVEPFSRQFDILSWWRLNGHSYPLLSHIARDILCVQVSTVSLESAFSGGGRILDSFRSSLHPKMVEALMCSRDWLLTKRLPQVMIEECIEELENLYDSQSVFAEMETASEDTHSNAVHISSTTSEDGEESN